MQRNKKSKMDENHIVNDDDFAVEEEVNIYETCNNKDETEKSSQKMQTVAEYSRKTIDTPHAGGPLNTSYCKIFGLIKTKEGNKEIGAIPLNDKFLYSLLFKKEFDRKVLVQRVAGNSTVASVEVTRSGIIHRYVEVGAEFYLVEGDLIGIQSNQNQLF